MVFEEKTRVTVVYAGSEESSWLPRKHETIPKNSQKKYNAGCANLTA